MPAWSTLGPDAFERELAAGDTPLCAACFAGRCGLSHHSSSRKLWEWEIKQKRP